MTPLPLSAADGERLVSIARRAIEGHVVRTGDEVEREEPSLEFLREPRGVFVTITTSKGALRGCIGFPYPVKALGAAIREAAVSAASSDPRFPPVEPRELDDLLVEVSALTVPEPLEPRSPLELPKLVRIGVDGLIVRAPGTSGLLLPQVATEMRFTAEDFLSQTCMKAGLFPDSWLTGAVKVFRFQAEIFRESPRR